MADDVEDEGSYACEDCLDEQVVSLMCDECEGSGYVILDSDGNNIVCDACDGTGTLPEDCPKCTPTTKG